MANKPVAKPVEQSSDTNPDNVVLTHKVTRHYGKFSVEFGISRIFPKPATHGEMVGYYDKLTEAIISEFYIYEESEAFQKNMKHGTYKDDAPQRRDSSKDENETFDALEIIKEVKGGKVYYAIKTKQAAFARHGAPLWKDKAEEFEIEDMLSGGYSKKLPEGSTIVVNKSGQHKRVISLRLGGQ